MTTPQRFIIGFGLLLAGLILLPNEVYEEAEKVLGQGKNGAGKKFKRNTSKFPEAEIVNSSSSNQQISKSSN